MTKAIRIFRHPWKYCAVCIAGATEIVVFGWWVTWVPRWPEHQRPWAFWVSRDATPQNAVVRLGGAQWEP